MANLKRNGYYKSQMFDFGNDVIRKVDMVVTAGCVFIRQTMHSRFVHIFLSHIKLDGEWFPQTSFPLHLNHTAPCRWFCLFGSSVQTPLCFSPLPLGRSRHLHRPETAGVSPSAAGLQAMEFGGWGYKSPFCLLGDFEVWNFRSHLAQGGVPEHRGPDPEPPGLSGGPQDHDKPVMNILPPSQTLSPTR